MTEKEPFQSREEHIYLAPADVWRNLCAFVEHEQLAALSALKGVDPMSGVMDASRSAYIELTFNDKPLGGSSYVSKSIPLYALDQHCIGHLAEELHALLLDAAAHGKKTQKRPEPAQRAFASAGDRWFCPHCGYQNESNKFCAECGSPRS